MQTISKATSLNQQPQATSVKSPTPSRYPFALRLLRLFFAVFGRLLPQRAARIGFRLFSTPRTRAKHKISDPIIEQASIFELLYGDHLLKGYQWGKSDRTILLVHGWESRGTALRTFVPDLLKQGFQVVTFDAPAHGNSGGKQTNLPHFSGAIRSIIQRYDGVYGIVAHSFGGASTVFTLANPDHSIEVQRLVLIATPSNLSGLLGDFLKMVNAPKAMVKGFWQLVAGKLRVPIEEVDMTKIAGKVRVGRLLVVHDREDQIVPFSEGQTIVDHWKNSELLVTEGWGHFQLVKNEGVIDRVAHFMKA